MPDSVGGWVAFILLAVAFAGMFAVATEGWLWGDDEHDSE